MTHTSTATPLEPLQPLDQRLAVPMQSLMTHVLRKTSALPAAQIMVVGAAPGVGCSFITNQLAAELGTAFSAVLVVEVTDTAAAQHSPVRDHAASDGRIAMHTRLPQAACMELFGKSTSARQADELRQWQQHFPLILWDVPPPTVTPAALVMAAQVPDFILVAQAERTRRQVAQHVCRQIEHSGASLMGVVLNRTVNHIPDWAYRLL